MRQTIFHEEWWLDAVAPNGWHEVVDERGGRASGYLRFAKSSKGGLSVCEMPPLARMLGPVVMSQADKAESRVRFNHVVIARLLEQINGFDRISMTLHPGFEDLLPFLDKGYEIRVMPTFLLDCARPIEVIWCGLRDKTRNVVRRAREILTVRDIDDAEVFSNFYCDNLEGEKSYFDIRLIKPIFEAVSRRGKGKIIAAVDGNNRTHAMIFLVHDDSYVYYFLSTRNKRIAHPGSVGLLLWTGINLAHDLGLNFDFDGVTSGSRFQFMAGFGGELANRYEVSRTTMLFETQNKMRTMARAILKPGRRRP